MELEPLKITQNQGDLFLSVRHAISCRNCGDVKVCPDGEADSVDFSQEMDRNGWKADGSETAVCPKCAANPNRTPQDFNAALEWAAKWIEDFAKGHSEETKQFASNMAESFRANKS